MISDKLLENLDKEYTLWCPSHGCAGFDNVPKVINEAVQKQSHEPFFKWFEENNFWEYINCDWHIDKLKRLLSGKELEELEEKEAEVREIIRSRDNSNPVEQYLLYTQPVLFFYDTDLWVESSYGDDFDEAVRKIKRFLGIKIRDTTYDRRLMELVENAICQGSLRLYFRADVENMLALKDKNVMTIDNFRLAIVNSVQGAGYDVEMPLKITFAFSPANIWVDDATSYSYDSICSLSCDFANDVTISFKKDLRYEVAEEHTTMHEYMKEETEFEEIYQSGGCSFHDSNMSRHETKYNNTYPAGWTCTKCGRFWID